MDRRECLSCDEQKKRGYTPMDLKYDELSETLNRVNSWIENCDSKVSTILSGIGVFAGILLATDYVSKFTAIFRYMCEKKTVSSTYF